MPGDPRQCRLNAARCLALAKRVRKPEARQVFTEMAETWNRAATGGFLSQLSKRSELAEALWRFN